MGAPDTRWPVHRGLKDFYAELRIRPVATSVVLASIHCGVGALILGERASRAFTIIGGQGGGALIAHLMGVLMLLGGVLAIAGSLRLGSLVELLGLGLAAAGLTIYGGGVLIGLGINGFIAGSLALYVAAGVALRVLLLSATAKRLLDDSR
jgi:hypothetical protein